MDKSLDQQAWKNVQKELKRKRSFSEGEISTNYQSKLCQNSKRPAAVQAVERLDAKLTGDIRIQVSVEQKAGDFLFQNEPFRTTPGMIRDSLCYQLSTTTWL